ncbi:NAD-P-binding protein [Trametes meyenii]|nr:NAD-P-binding protein [Trametes meyenii]
MLSRNDRAHHGRGLAPSLLPAPDSLVVAPASDLQVSASTVTGTTEGPPSTGPGPTDGPVQNARWVFNEIPEGFPEPGRTMVYDAAGTLDVARAPLAPGEFLVKVLVLSVDPYLRIKMRDPRVESFTPAFVVGEPLYNFGIGLVVRSENAAFRPGDHLHGVFKFQHYVIEHDHTQFRVIENEENLPWSVYVGVCGMPGETASHAWREYAHPKKGEVVFVTSASGTPPAPGATVVQLAKADGLKVIASAGSDEKVAFAKSIGADVAFNYKTTRVRDVLAKEGPVNIYWDNVGGEMLEAAIDHAESRARFIACGMISEYNSTQPYHVKNLMRVFVRELQIHGFLFTALQDKYAAEFRASVPRRVARGEIVYREHRLCGLGRAGTAVLDVLSGRNFGKCVVIVAEE